MASVDLHLVFYWLLGPYVGPTCLHPSFRSEAVSLFADVMGGSDTLDCLRWIATAPGPKGVLRRTATSRDGKHCFRPPDTMKATYCAELSLASAAIGSLNLDWVGALPPSESPTMADCSSAQTRVINVRVLVALVYERLGRIEEAIRWARTE